jgi:hypothetical protein
MFTRRSTHACTTSWCFCSIAVFDSAQKMAASVYFIPCASRDSEEALVASIALLP